MVEYRKFAFNKLVRDDIVSQMIENGAKPVFRVLKTDEYMIELKKKLVEEFKEINSATEPQNIIKELADIQEILDKLISIIFQDSSKLVQFRNFNYDLEGYIELLFDTINSLNNECMIRSIKYYISLAQYSVRKIALLLEFTMLDLIQFQLKKNKKAGSFDKKYYIEYVLTPPAYPYLDHYLANSDRYPEKFD